MVGTATTIMMVGDAEAEVVADEEEEAEAATGITRTNGRKMEETTSPELHAVSTAEIASTARCKA